ncbi:MAG: Ig-like domain-containing protein [Bacteroidetes bacterium]|nr:Ig-like domain-containing protein [Bacteroidota bacterium]
MALFILALGVLLLQPVSGFAQPTDLSGLKFCIDPGHGGHNAANDRHVIPDAGTDFWESESNFQKALRLDTLLQARGAWVILTRYTNDYPADDEPSLSARRTLANANNVHWFHSIHSNATGWASNTTVNYTLMLVREEISTRQPSWPQAVTMSNIIGPAIQAKLRNSPRSTWTYLDYTFYGGTNGGFNLGVLNGTSMPAELSEGSFHDFFPETRRLMNRLYCKMEAYALRNSFMQYYGVPADTMGIIAGIQSNVASGELVNLARVRLLPDDRVVVGDAYNNGFYMFDNVAPGTYTLRFETPGYTMDSVQVTVGTGATVFADRSLVSFASPSVLATLPANNDTMFSAVSAIEVSFSKPMDTASVRSAFSITPTVPGQLVWNSSNTRLTFDPAQILPFYVDFVVEIDTTARSASGQGLDADGDGVSGDPLVLSFRTTYIDVFAPVLVQARPDSGERLTAPQAVLNLTFDERLNPSTVTIANIVVQRIGGTAQLRTLEYAEENEKAGVSVYFPNGLLPGEAYRAGIKGIADPLGNAMPTSTFQLWDFSIGSGAYVTTVLDSIAAATPGFVSPALPADMAGAESVLVVGSTGKKLGLDGANAGSAQIRVQWDTSATQWLVRVRTDSTRPVGQMQFRKTGTLLRAYVYGDGSHSPMRLVIADSLEAYPARPPERREVTRWIPIDWVGWRAVTWDLEADTLGSGTGNGILEGQLAFDGIEVAYVPGTSLPLTSVYVDHLELVDRTVTDVEAGQHGVPARFALHQNTPNPFNPSTKIWYDLGTEGDVSLVVYDVLGREVARLVDRHQTAGRHWAEWGPSMNRTMSSGVYVARLMVTGEGGTQLFGGSIKLMMVK